jgi:hypothetical protein
MHWYLAIIVNPARILEPSEPPVQSDPPRTRSSLGTDARALEPATREPSSSPESETKDDEPPADLNEEYGGPKPPEIRVVSASQAQASGSSDRVAQAQTDGTTSKYFTQVRAVPVDVDNTLASDTWEREGGDTADRVTKSTSQLTLYEDPSPGPSSPASSDSTSFSPELLGAYPSKARVAEQGRSADEAMDVEELDAAPACQTELAKGEASSTEEPTSRPPEVPASSADEPQQETLVVDGPSGSATSGGSPTKSVGKIDPRVDPEGYADRKNELAVLFKADAGPLDATSLHSTRWAAVTTRSQSISEITWSKKPRISCTSRTRHPRKSKAVKLK